MGSRFFLFARIKISKPDKLDRIERLFKIHLYLFNNFIHY
jgi:hypothetical protein